MVKLGLKSKLQKTTRVTVDLSASEYAKLQRLHDQLGISKADVVRNGLRALEYFAGRVGQGWSINVSKGKITETVELFDKVSAG